MRPATSFARHRHIAVKIWAAGKGMTLRWGTGRGGPRPQWRRKAEQQSQVKPTVSCFSHRTYPHVVEDYEREAALDLRHALQHALRGGLAAGLAEGAGGEGAGEQARERVERAGTGQCGGWCTVGERVRRSRR